MCHSCNHLVGQQQTRQPHVQCELSARTATLPGVLLGERGVGIHRPQVTLAPQAAQGHTLHLVPACPEGHNHVSVHLPGDVPI